jgi:mannose-6-phosphate isomerase-like protein (cupin superfamily)
MQGMLQLLFVFSGTAQVQLDSDEREYESAIAVIIPPGVIHAFRFESQTRAMSLPLMLPGWRLNPRMGHKCFPFSRKSRCDGSGK